MGYSFICDSKNLMINFQNSKSANLDYCSIIHQKNSTIYYTNDFDTALLSWQAIQQRNNALWISVFKILTVSFHNHNFHYKSDQWIWSQKLGYSISGINVKLKQNRFLAKNEFWTCINFIHFSCFSRKKFYWWERVIK